MKPLEVVRSRFMGLHIEHIRFVLNGLMENTTRVRSMKQYLLAALYNAPLTMKNSSRARTNHDFYADGNG